MGRGNREVMRPNRFIRLLAALPTILLWASPALAFQEHGPPEGLYIHQLAHICLALSMIGLWYGIRHSRFRKDQGWQRMAIGAALLTVWNIMTFTGHILSLYTMPAMRQSNAGVPAWMELTWHILKLDNIVCVAAMLYFYAGLKRLLQDTHPAADERGQKNA